LKENISVDADLTSVVPCTDPHLYDVVALETWPGMDDLLQDGDPAAVQHRLQLGATDDAEAYWTWSWDFCVDAIERAVGWADVKLGITDDAGNALTTTKIAALPGGQYLLDRSLADEATFAAGEHRTACSAAWVDPRGKQRELILPAGLGFGDIFDDRMPIAARACLDDEGMAADCGPGTAEITATFDVAAATSDEEVIRLAAADGTDPDDYASIDRVCAALTGQLPHPRQIDETLSWLIWNGDWDRVRRTHGVLVHTQYFATCYGYPGGF
jgi:hypothetical protein